MGNIWYIYVQSVHVKFFICLCNYCGKIMWRFRSRTSLSCDKSSGHDKILASGGPLLLQVFFRSITTFTSALLFYLLPASSTRTYILVALREKVMAPPRLNVAELSVHSSHLILPDHDELFLWHAPVSPVGGCLVKLRGGGIVYLRDSGRPIAFFCKIHVSHVLHCPQKQTCGADYNVQNDWNRDEVKIGPSNSIGWFNTSAHVRWQRAVH